MDTQVALGFDGEVLGEVGFDTEALGDEGFYWRF